MKKTLLILLVSVLFSSCENTNKQPFYIKGNSAYSHTMSSGSIIYIKDTRTGLCFAERGSAQTYTITCVPCDSVEKLIQK